MSDTVRTSRLLGTAADIERLVVQEGVELTGDQVVEIRRARRRLKNALAEHGARQALKANTPTPQSCRALLDAFTEGAREVLAQSSLPGWQVDPAIVSDEGVLTCRLRACHPSRVRALLFGTNITVLVDQAHALEHAAMNQRIVRAERGVEQLPGGWTFAYQPSLTHLGDIEWSITRDGKLRASGTAGTGDRARELAVEVSSRRTEYDDRGRRRAA